MNYRSRTAHVATFSLLLAVLASGCITTPSPTTDGQVYSAYATGDRASFSFDEIVVSLPFSGASGPYQNLHVGLAASINARKFTLSDTYDVEDILRRMEPRLDARLSESLSHSGSHSVSDTDELRKKIAAEAQTVVNDALSQWKHGPDYHVEIVVENLYWTDASVGRVLQQRRLW